MYVSIVVIVIAYFLSVLTSYRGYVLQMTFNENKHIEVQNIQRNNLISIRVLFCFFFLFFLTFLVWYGLVLWCFSPDTPVSSTNKADRHDITEI